jgi:streptogramin lyase
MRSALTLVCIAGRRYYRPHFDPSQPMSPFRAARFALLAPLLLPPIAFPQHTTTSTGRDLSSASASQLLRLLPDGEEKRRFILDCTGCHTFDARIAAPSGRARTIAQWDSATHRMLQYAGATSNFPVISAARDPASTAEWLARWITDASLAAVAPAPPRGSPKVREFMLPMPQDLPHDVAVDATGKVVITGMFSHKMYRLDPESGALETFDIPVERANPRAVVIDERGAWWVLFGAPRMVGRRDPESGEWKTHAIGMYPHSIGVDRSGRVWFNGHFTRDPEQLGFVDPASGSVTLRDVPLHPTMAKVAGGPIPYELRIAPDGSIWISELGGNRLVRHDPANNTFRVFDMPTPHSGPRRFDFDGQGALWIPEYASGKLTRLDPTTGRFTQWELPVKDAAPYVVRADRRRGDVWIGTGAADAVFRFDPRTAKFTTYELPTRGALVRHLDIDPRTGAVWAAYGASPGIPARVARIER